MIEKVEYDEMECYGNQDAVCPYCGYENQIGTEYYLGQGDTDIEECGNCEKYLPIESTIR